MQALLGDKDKIEKDLLIAKKNKDTAGPGADAGDMTKLQQRITELEEKLAEYSVIEDDLANLKRLQQENLQLKATLQGKGVAIPPPSAEASTGEPMIGAGPATAGAAAMVADAAVGEAPIVAAAPDAAFEGLVNQVEASLHQPAMPAAAPAPAAKIPATAAESIDPLAALGGIPSPAEPSTSAAPPDSIEKSDADLVAEFEKMLNS